MTTRFWLFAIGVGVACVTPAYAQIKAEPLLHQGSWAAFLEKDQFTGSVSCTARTKAPQKTWVWLDKTHRISMLNIERTDVAAVTAYRIDGGPPLADAQVSEVKVFFDGPERWPAAETLEYQIINLRGSKSIESLDITGLNATLQAIAAETRCP